MATNLALNDELIADAVRVGNHKTKREAVTAALTQYVKLLKQRKILELEGKVDFSSDYDYKEARRRGNKRIPKD